MSVSIGAGDSILWSREFGAYVAFDQCSLFFSLAHGQGEAGSGDETRTYSMPCPSRRKLGWSGALEASDPGWPSGGQGKIDIWVEEKGRTREL